MARWEYCMLTVRGETLTDSRGQQRNLLEIEMTIYGNEQTKEFKSIPQAHYELGRNGWELVTIVPTPSGVRFWERHYFKRPLVKRQQT